MNHSGLVKGKKLPTAESVARAGFRSMKEGQRVIIPGAMHWTMSQSVRFTPRRTVTSLVKSMSKPA